MLLDRLRRRPDYYYIAAEDRELPDPRELAARQVANKAVGGVLSVQPFGTSTLEERWPTPNPSETKKKRQAS